jgi:hypothetical protein
LLQQQVVDAGQENLPGCEASQSMSASAAAVLFLQGLFWQMEVYWSRGHQKHPDSFSQGDWYLI